MALLTGLASAYTLAQQVFVPGLAKAEIYSGFGGTAIADLTNNAAYPSNPTSVSFVKFLEYPAGPDDGRPPAGDVMSNYGVRISGFIIPTESGNYTFYISADDNANFFLSTDDTPTNKRLLAWEPTWNPVRSFELDASGGRVDCLNLGNCENVSEPIALVANQRYYFEALMKEAGGGDNLAVAWSKDGAPLETFTYPNPDATVGGDLVTTLPIKSLNLGTMADSTVSITRQPRDTAGTVGGTAQFSVGINATPDVTYQWKKNGVDIPEATGATYTTPALVAGDNNAVYSVVATKAGANSVTSSNATLRVAGTSEVSGVALIEIFNGIGGTAVPATPSTLPAPNSFGSVTALNSDPVFGSLPNSDASRNDYLGKMTGYFIPATNGNYHFFVRSDDASKLWVSPNATFPNIDTTAPVARENGCCRAFGEPFELANTEADGTVTYTTTETAIPMVAGQKYAFVYIWKEGGGGDFGQVAVREENDLTPAASLTPIASARLSALVSGVGITSHPNNISVEENRSGSFSVSTLSSPGQTFQWQSAPAGSSTFANIANATNRTYTVSGAARTADGTQYRVIVANGADTQTSNPATLTVTEDVTAPTIASVGSFHNRTGLIVYFNEPVNASAGTFTLNNGATVQSTTVLGPTAVFLQTTAPLTASSPYTVTVNNVRDLSANGGNLVSPNTFNFTSSAAAPTPMTTGLAKYEKWDALSPNSIAGLITAIDTRPPDVVEPRAGFEAGSNGDTYGARLSGWVIPPSDGNYVFAVASDDQSRLYLSTDSDPANKKLIAQEASWTNSRVWTGKPDQQSSTFAGTQWPGGSTISLKGGQPYYLELIWQDGTGGDHGQVTFWKEGSPQGNGTATAIAGTNLVGNIAPDPAGPPVVISGPTGRVYNKGDSITLSVEAIGQGPLTYQWIRNKRPIPGATSQTYTIASADHTHVGDYSVLVSNANGSTESNYRGADDSARLLMASPTAFIIEAEDYNYEGGKHLTAASTMPYLGNAYAGLLPTLDVDYFNSPDQSGASADADAYGPRMPIAGPGYIETKGDGDAVNNAFNRNRGAFTLTANYALGWGNAGDWQNYTRTFPAGTYYVYAGVAQDGDPGADLATRTVVMDSTLSKVANPTIADGSAVGFEGGAQGLTPLGVFQSPPSGAWSSADLIPLTDAATGNPVTVQLSGTETLRWTQQSGIDSDFLLLYCITCTDPVGPPDIAISRNASGAITINFTGTLVSSPTVDGDYTPVAGAVAGTPYTVDPTAPMMFFQARR